MKIWFDGSARPNPGPIATTVVIRGSTHHADAGEGTNGDAEWRAAIAALQVAAEIGVRDVTLLGDSAMVVAQANGGKCKTDALRGYRDRFVELSGGFERVRVRKIARTQNLAGIALEQRLSGRAVFG